MLAFHGMISILKRTLKTEFIAGLPEKYFHEALLWIMVRRSLIRSVKQADGKRSIPYLSWTWAGWMAPSSYMYVFRALGRETYLVGEAEWFIGNRETAWKLDIPHSLSLLHPRGCSGSESLNKSCHMAVLSISPESTPAIAHTRSVSVFCVGFYRVCRDSRMGRCWMYGSFHGSRCGHLGRARLLRLNVRCLCHEKGTIGGRPMVRSSQRCVSV